MASAADLDAQLFVLVQERDRSKDPEVRAEANLRILEVTRERAALRGDANG